MSLPHATTEDCAPPPTRGRPKDMEKHKAILEAALDLFAAKGFIKTSMDEIARQAGVSKLTLYSHFEDKEKLFLCALEKRCFEDMPLGLMDEQFHGLGAPDALFKMGRYILDASLSPRAVSTFRVMLAEALAHPKLTKTYVDTVIGGMTKRIVVVLQYIAEQGGHKFPHLRKAAMQFYNLAKGPLHTLYIFNVEPLPTDAEQNQHLRDVTALFLRAHKS